jgi:hypothetical protein
MSCPPEVAAIIHEILTAGILRVRALGESGDAARCAIEADHLHNLPGLLTAFSPQSLRYYWEVERPSFIHRSSPADLALFEPLWKKLASNVAAAPNRVSA